MPLLPIVLVAVVMAADAGLVMSSATIAERWWLGGIAACGGPVIIVVLISLGIRRCIRSMHSGGGWRSVVAAERLSRWSRGLILANHAVAVLLLGWLDVVRNLIGNWVLVDELLVLLPAILGVLGTWWAYFPVERRLRDAMLIRRLDEGRAIHPMPSRRSYVLIQARMGLFLLLVPLLLILAWGEVVTWLSSSFWDEASPTGMTEIVTLVGAVVIFILTPLLARVLLHLESLSKGPVRDDMLEICRAHRVKVRDILLWKTSGSMINAAVMGLLAPLRYVLLTDALLETMSRHEVQAVMAHEIGHVRRHHMPWLLVGLLASIALAQILVDGPLLALTLLDIRWSPEVVRGVSIGATIATLAVALLLFGWISRRFERQADSFAVQHLSRMTDTAPGENAGSAAPEDPDSTTALSSNATDDGDPPPIVVREDAVAALKSALHRIAHLNAVDPHRRSWRHGSIAWRRAYLSSLVGMPLDRLPIDRVIRRIQVAAVCVLIVAGGLLTYVQWTESPAHRDAPVIVPSESVVMHARPLRPGTEFLGSR